MNNKRGLIYLNTDMHATAKQKKDNKISTRDTQVINHIMLTKADI